MTRPFIPFFKPEIDEATIADLGDTLRSGWLTTGPKTREFEERFAGYVGASHAVAVNSCTAALHLVLAAKGIGDGDEVIVPSWTFASTAAVVVHLGARPVLVDSTPGTLNMDVENLERAISANTKAVIPVHFGGHPADMEPILELAQHHGLAVIEDAAHALPARYRNRMVGTIGHATCFSFYATKTLTTGEGGMITTEDEALARRVRLLSLHGLSDDAWDRYAATGSWDYDVVEPGYKYNLTDIAATIGLHQLAAVDTFHAGRKSQAESYDRMFAEVAGVDGLEVAEDVVSSHHLYPIRLGNEFPMSRNQLIEALRNEGIGTSVHFRPLHLHPWYRENLGLAPEDFPVASDSFGRILSLPIYPSLAPEDLARVADTIAGLGGA